MRLRSLLHGAAKKEKQQEEEAERKREERLRAPGSSSSSGGGLFYARLRDLRNEILVWAAPVLVCLAFLYFSGLFQEFGLRQQIGALLDRYGRYGWPMLIKVVVGAVLTFATTLWSSRWERARWEKQEFLKHVQVSLNYVADEDGDGKKLRFRTLDECGVDELMYNNKHAISKILEAARSTTCDDPFLRSDPHSMDLIMKAVTNRISIKFSSGYLDYDVNNPVIRKEYWLGLTCEKPDVAKGERFGVKLRVMVASDNFLNLTDWVKDRGPDFFEHPGHTSRWNCLRKMHQVLDQDRAEQSKGGGEFRKRQLLRKVTVFRPALQISSTTVAEEALLTAEEHDRVRVVRKGSNYSSSAQSSSAPPPPSSTSTLRQRLGFMRKHASSWAADDDTPTIEEEGDDEGEIMLGEGNGTMGAPQADPDVSMNSVLLVKQRSVEMKQKVG